MLNKKENKPDHDSPDHDTGYILTPNTSKRYEHINQQFDEMMKNSGRPIHSVSLENIFN